MDVDNEYEHIEIKSTDLVAWPRIAAVSAMVSFSLPTFVTGLEIYQALTVQDALWALLIGSLILTLIGGAMGTIGVRSRLSSYLLVRIAFGNAGASIVNLAFAVSLIGWFGFNIDLFSNAVVQLLSAEFNVVVPEWPIDIFAGICMLVTTLYGFKAINILASIMVPILAIVTGMMLFGAIEVMSFSQYLAFEKASTLTLGDGVSAIVGVVIIGAIILPDITRFSKQKNGGIYTVFCSYMVVELFVLFVSIFAATAMQETEILSLMLELNLGFSAFFIIIAGSWVLNSLNLYSTTLSVEATFPKWNKKIVIIVLGAIGILAAFMNILDIFIAFLSFLSDIFVPVAGVIIIDALFIKPNDYNITTLENHFKFSIPAFFAWLVGAAYAVFNGVLFSVDVTGITVIDAIVLTSIIYIVLMKSEKYLPFPTMIK
jgi:cytosine permease